MTWWSPNGILARADELAKMTAAEQSPSLRMDGGLRNNVSWIGLDRYVPPQVPSPQQTALSVRGVMAQSLDEPGATAGISVTGQKSHQRRDTVQALSRRPRWRATVV